MSPDGLLETFTLGDLSGSVLRVSLDAFIEDLNLSDIQVEFLNILNDTVDFQLSELELEALSDLIETDLLAFVASELNCQFIEIVVEQITQIGFFSPAVGMALESINFVFYQNFAPTTSFFIGIGLETIALPVSSPAQQEMLIADFVSGLERCVPELDPNSLSIVNESFNFFFV